MGMHHRRCLRNLSIWSAEEITEGELTKKEKLKIRWTALEALAGDPKRIALIAADLVMHFEKRVEAMDGKAMIVCRAAASARISAMS